MTTTTPVAGAASHGGPTQSFPTCTGPVEVAPPLLPAVLDLGRAGAPERLPEPFLAAGVGVGDELDAALAVDLLEAEREQLEHHRAGDLGPLGTDLDGDAPETAQRNALFSFSKKPSSCL